MPLVPAVLLDGLVQMFRKGAGSEPEAAEAWAAAFRKFMEPLAIPPPVNGARHVLAEAAMRGALAGMSVPGMALVKLQTGLSAYVGVIAVNSAPIAVPPPPVVLPALPPVSDPVAAASALTSVIAPWVLTGTWTVPPAPPVPWL